MIGLRRFLPAEARGGATFPGGTGDVDAAGRPGEPPWRDGGDLMAVVSMCLLRWSVHEIILSHLRPVLMEDNPLLPHG